MNRTATRVFWRRVPATSRTEPLGRGLTKEASAPLCHGREPAAPVATSVGRSLHDRRNLVYTIEGIFL